MASKGGGGSRKIWCVKGGSPQKIPLYLKHQCQKAKHSISKVLKIQIFPVENAPGPLPRRATRGHEAACSEKLLRLLSDRAQTLHNDRNFNSKQSYCFCFLILTVFAGK